MALRTRPAGLTRKWLWEYFFTRESDFHDKETKAQEYISSRRGSAAIGGGMTRKCHRVFKIAMLIMAVMSTTKGLNTAGRPEYGISATWTV
jgi:hypothetical protein